MAIAELLLAPAAAAGVTPVKLIVQQTTEQKQAADARYALKEADKALAVAEELLVGRKVQKYFDTDGWNAGQVLEYNACTRCYTVQYADRNGEQCTSDELLKILIPEAEVARNAEAIAEAIEAAEAAKTVAEKNERIVQQIARQNQAADALKEANAAITSARAAVAVAEAVDVAVVERAKQEAEVNQAADTLKEANKALAVSAAAGNAEEAIAAKRVAVESERILLRVARRKQAADVMKEANEALTPATVTVAMTPLVDVKDIVIALCIKLAFHGDRVAVVLNRLVIPLCMRLQDTTRWRWLSFF